MTITAFSDALSSLVIVGVSRRVDTIPIDVNVADLPVQYVTRPSSDYSFFTFGRVNINPVRTSELTVLVRPVVMGTNNQNYYDVGEMANNVVDALDALITDANLDSYQIDLEPRTIHGTDYHAVIATVTGRDK